MGLSCLLGLKHRAINKCGGKQKKFQVLDGGELSVTRCTPSPPPLGAIQQRKYGIRNCLDMMEYVKISASNRTPSLKPELPSPQSAMQKDAQYEGCLI
jgi:hypothetical protein